MRAEKIGWNNVNGVCANCTDCPYFEPEKRLQNMTVTAFCHYMNSTPHGIDKFDIYRCQRIVEDYENYNAFCESVIGTGHTENGQLVIYTK